MGRLLLIALPRGRPGGVRRPAGRARATRTPTSPAPRAIRSAGGAGRATVPAALVQRRPAATRRAARIEVQVATVTFPHRDHAEGHEIEPTCAGATPTTRGRSRCEASVDACALCHVSEVTERRRAGVPALPRAAGPLEPDEPGCGGVRTRSCPGSRSAACAATTTWRGRRRKCRRCECRQCHEDLSVLNERAVGRDLHPIHEGVTCTACHEEGLHEVKAMSSAVELVCADCHLQAHDVDVELGGVAVRAECVPSATRECTRRSSGSFWGSARMAAPCRARSSWLGMTCRSCHIPPADQARYGGDADPGAGNRVRRLPPAGVCPGPGLVDRRVAEPARSEHQLRDRAAAAVGAPLRQTAAR